ncbi:FkbM family methyltransferase [Variovorax ureilyticus]|uniref:FkbM family methyltransferase n=1 Tax=Variovorax ureilyticus TaxID=1836198 RepID=A0ABU8VDI2_9BURK
MSFVSYAQNFEDVMLWRALRHVQGGFYIDIGAQSPDLDSVTRAFSESGWRGINVEPHPGYYAELVNRRPRDINLRCALGEALGTATINLVGATGLSTLDKSIADRHFDAGHGIEQIEVEVETLSGVWDRHVPSGQPVHFLKVDVEGFELQVLRGNDWTRHRPWIVVVEATLPNSQTESFSEWEPHLTSAQFEFAYADGLNRYYVAQEQAQLRNAFRYPPNVFDNFVVAPLESARHELRRLESTLASTTTRVSGLESSLQTSQDELSRSQSQLAVRDLRLQEIEACLDQVTVRAETAESGLRDARNDIGRMQSSLMDARNEIGRLQSELGELRNSRSWRLTAPLRLVGRHLRRFVSDSSAR